MWRPLLVCLVVSLIVGGVFGFQLGGLAKGASAAEQTYIVSTTSGKKLLQDPTFILHKIPTYVLFKLGVNQIGYYRAVSAIFAAIAIVSCFFILREWHTDRVAILGTALFLTSAWVLHIGRLATPESSYFLMMPLLWCTVWLYNTTLRKSAILLLSLLAALSVYIPGFGWFLVIAILWKRKLLWKEIVHVPVWFRAICLLLILIVLTPVAIAAIKSLPVLLAINGLPAQLPNLKQTGQNFINIPVQLLIKGPGDPTKWLGRLPILDAFSAVMLVLGAYSLRYQLKLPRAHLLLAITSLIILFIGSGGPVTISALMPAVYLLVAAGIAFMLQQWFAVFPHNPVARTLATTIMSVVVILTSYYHVRHYFIAWPQTPATKASFGRSIADIH